MKTTARYQEWLTGVKHLMVDVNTKQKQVDIAGKIKITPVYLNAVLRGRRIAAPLTQDKISEALGADYDAIRERGRAAMGLPPLGVTVSTTQNGRGYGGAGRVGTKKAGGGIGRNRCESL